MPSTELSSSARPTFSGLPAEVQDILDSAPSVIFASSVEELQALALRDEANGFHDVYYETPGKGAVLEARVCRARNGIVANYPEPYMRRRDADCMVIGDDRPSDQERYADRFGEPFDGLREETFRWLKSQDLAVFAFHAGTGAKGFPGLAICPSNAGFFALGLAMIQGILPVEALEENLVPRAFVFVAPPFRHTKFEGKQVVVHNRREGAHELFSYNLYPGPSAKKGIYGMLLEQGEAEGWITAHCSTVQAITPYDNRVVFMHEGASGGGKSEMLQYPHRETDGRLLLGKNIQSGESRHVTLPRGCELRPVTDDMALCHRTMAGRERKLSLCDAEQAWFVRVNHITQYGTDPEFEKLTIQPPEPLLFFSIDSAPGGRALIFDHTLDAPGKPCPNPRVIVPRRIVPGIVQGDVTVDVRSFGVRSPPCTADKPTFGIFGMLQILPPALAWLWRLTSPRGYDNPSIIYTGTGIPSEGVGSFWPFATGRRVQFANLLLRQIMSTTDTLYILTPNQHIGVWRVGFMPQWIAREYLARRGASRFREDQLIAARCPLLGWLPAQLQIEGNLVSNWFLRVESQPEVGEAAYDKGAEMLKDFFREQLALFRDEPDLDPLGREIIDCCLRNGSAKDYAAFTGRTE